MSEFGPREETRESRDERMDDDILSHSYDAAYSLVERRQDQGLDSTAAWEEADPNGEIRKVQSQKEARDQAELNHKWVVSIQRDIHDRKVAEINAIEDPDERRRAMVELLAREQVAKQRRGSRA